MLCRWRRTMSAGCRPDRCRLLRERRRRVRPLQRAGHPRLIRPAEKRVEQRTPSRVGLRCALQHAAVLCRKARVPGCDGAGSVRRRDGAWRCASSVSSDGAWRRAPEDGAWRVRERVEGQTCVKGAANACVKCAGGQACVKGRGGRRGDVCRGTVAWHARFRLTYVLKLLAYSCPETESAQCATPVPRRTLSWHVTDWHFTASFAPSPAYGRPCGHRREMDIGPLVTNLPSLRDVRPLPARRVRAKMPSGARNRKM